MLNALQKVYVICNFRLFNILNADVLSVFTYRVKLCYCRTGKKSYNVFPFKFIDRLAVYEIEPDESEQFGITEPAMFYLDSIAECNADVGDGLWLGRISIARFLS